MEVKNESFEELFKVEETKKLRRIKPGEKITATIVGIGQETTFLDVGGKSEGVLNSSELADKEGNFTKATGDRIDVYFLQTKGSEQLFTEDLSKKRPKADLKSPLAAIYVLSAPIPRWD